MYCVSKGSYANHVATKGGGGVPQKTTTLHNSYLVKVATLGGEGQNSEKIATRFVYGPIIASSIIGLGL